MNLTLIRYNDNRESTLGLLFMGGKFVCYTLEDEGRTKKVYGETRIPQGIYKLKLRIWGSFHERYKQKFAGHVGMIQIEKVKGFTDVLFHIGNDDDDTAGCILVGDSVNNNVVKDGFIGNSTNAYKRFYEPVALELDKRGDVALFIYDALPLPVIY